MLLRISLALVPILAFTACGGGSSGAEDPGGRAVEHTNAFFAGDAEKAYSYYAPNCRDIVSQDEYEETVDGLLVLFEGFVGADPDDIEAGDPDVDIDGSTAEVTLALHEKGSDEPLLDPETSTWRQVQGTWYLISCDDMVLE